MARDLIPPPSPAGRPTPDPEPREDALVPPATEAEAASKPAAPAGPGPYRSRFGFVTGALIGAGLAAVVALVALLSGTSGGDDGVKLADHWSSWTPSSTDVVAGPNAIAKHVEPAYQGADHKQLVAVQGGPFVVVNQGTGIPFAIKLQPEDGTIRSLGANGVLYTLSGTGSGGRIEAGKPSVARHRLLRREALELALYSFRYLGDIRMVVTLLPPLDPVEQGKGKKQASTQENEAPQLQAVFYQPGDLRRQLESPLSRTLGPGLRTPQQLAAGPEAKRIDRLTLGNLFFARFQTQQDGQLYLVLERKKPSSSG